MTQFWYGIAIGGLTTLLAAYLFAVFAIGGPLHRMTEECKRVNNVYECAFASVPVAAPTWVPKK